MIRRTATRRARFDESSFRADTPGASNVVHLNAAGAGLPPRLVTDTVVSHLEREASVGPHWAAAEAGPRLEGVRTSVASLLQCRPHNVGFGGSAGQLWAMAFLAMPLRPDARILVAGSEWAGNVLNLLKQKRAGAIAIDVMPAHEPSGRIDVERAASLIDERTVAICMPVVASGSGVRQPLELIAALPRPDGCLLFVDGAQVIGQMPLGLANTGADVLVAPSRKWLRGPRGEAIMALSDRALGGLGDPPILSQTGSAWTCPGDYATRSDGRRFEVYEFSVAGRLGLGTAIDYAMRHGINNIRETIRARLARLHAGLSAIPNVTVFERIDAEPAFLTFAAASLAPADLNRKLAEANIAAAVVERQYARANLALCGLEAVSRVAPHAYTSDADVDRFLDTVSVALRERWRNAS